MHVSEYSLVIIMSLEKNVQTTFMPEINAMMNAFAESSDEEERKALAAILASTNNSQLSESSSESGLDNDFYEVVVGIYEERYPEKLEGGKHTKELLTKMEESSILNKTHMVSDQAAKAKFSAIANLKEQSDWTNVNFIDKEIEKMNQTVRAEVRDTLGLPRKNLRDPVRDIYQRRQLFEEMNSPVKLPEARKQRELPPVEIAYRDKARLK